MIDFEKSWNHSFSVLGHWWLPENSENKIPGTLKYENGRIRVELLGTFETSSILRAIEPDNIPIINGRAEGRLLTLLDCRTVGRDIHTESEGTSTLNAKFAIEGAICTNIEVMHFTDATVRFHHLGGVRWGGSLGSDPGLTGV